MTAVLERNAALEIEQACIRLMMDYAAHADAGRYDAWAELFAEDAEMELFGNISRGRAAIKAGVSGGGATGRQTMHCTSNCRVDIKSDTEATGEAYVVVFAGQKSGDGPAKASPLTPVIVGIYTDRYRKTAEGWRIARRAFTPTIMAG